ncbi:MAG: maltose alpha-D-glucosyltransferase [Bryobacteraceae bacterium]|nr:maltose alpha-D-glucosyltransferase [Bryobacteraceae bacterium]
MPHDTLWYKDAVIYELHVRAFADSDNDGMGDFAGLSEKLDYLQDLGVTALWLLPFFPSPWKDDGYDIADYNAVHPAYGTLKDVERFLTEAHRRGLRVITELVLNHTSDQHPWFQRARRAAPGSRWRDFYVWSDTPLRYTETRIIFKDFETSNWTWDPVANAYFWHRFYSHQPDLNYDNPEVREAMTAAVDYWLAMGVDGLRLDAVPYLYEREGTNCENLPETHQFLKDLRAHVDARFPGRLFLAEANQWPEDAIAYFGNGDECHMAFHFPLMPRLFMGHRMEDRFPIIDILERTPAIPDNCQWALFLRNHDELTLEMVTDEERDYMYRMYAEEQRARINLGIRRRLAPLLENDRRRIELMNALLFSMPGSPVIYYGDEIGMGDNIFLGDRNGVRTPMQWSPDRNAGFSRANPQRLYLPIIIDPEYHYEALNVEAQQRNPSSLLWWMKHLIALRKNSKALSRGTIEFLHPENRKVLAFLRQYEDEIVLMVVNLSRYPQNCELDLSRFEGSIPVELLGRTEFPRIGQLPYFITLGRHGYYWFQLQSVKHDAVPTYQEPPARIPELAVRNWASPLDTKLREDLAEILPSFLERVPWLPGRRPSLRRVSVEEAFRLDDRSILLLVRGEFRHEDPALFVLPLALSMNGEASPADAVAKLKGPDGREAIATRGLLSEALRRALLLAVRNQTSLTNGGGSSVTGVRAGNEECWSRTDLPSTLHRTSTGNAIVTYGDCLTLKLYRQPQQGIDPEIEIGEFLTRHSSFTHTPALAGWLSYQPAAGEPYTLAVVHHLTPNQGEAWDHAVTALGNYLEHALAQPPEARVPPAAGMTLHQPAPLPTDGPAPELLAAFAGDAELLGRRTAEMHLALASNTADAAFAPEPFTDLYRKSLYHGMVATANSAFETLKVRLRRLPDDSRSLAERLLALEARVLGHFLPIRDRRFQILRTRTHGDYNLRRILRTGSDFLILGFEGEPSRPISERRLKRSPLRDVASMIRSFHYAAYSVLTGRLPGVAFTPENATAMEGWARYWYLEVSGAFLSGYLKAARGAAFLPESQGDLRILLDAYMMDKVIYELGYELQDRPDWALMPLLGIAELLGER